MKFGTGVHIAIESATESFAVRVDELKGFRLESFQLEQFRLKCCGWCDSTTSMVVVGR